MKEASARAAESKAANDKSKAAKDAADKADAAGKRTGGEVLYSEEYYTAQKEIRYNIESRQYCITSAHAETLFLFLATSTQSPMAYARGQVIFSRHSSDGEEFVDAINNVLSDDSEDGFVNPVGTSKGKEVRLICSSGGTSPKRDIL